MIDLKSISAFLLLTVAGWSILLAPGTATAQSQVFIERADRAEGAIINGQNVRKLLNNVVLRTDDMRMEADSAYQFIDQNLIHAFNIQIETENEMIWADTLFHNTATDVSRFRGRVIIESETNILFSQQMDLFSPIDLAVFDVPVRFEDEDGILIAEQGFYFQDVDSAGFRGNVQLADETQYLEADSLFMNRSIGLYELFGRVYGEDFEDNTVFTGNYLFADSTGYRLLRGDSSWLMEVSESEADTTHLLAREIEIIDTDTTSTLDAFQNVRIWSNRFAAVADSATFYEHLEITELRSNPILWRRNIQLTGPFIEATFDGEELTFLRSFERPIVVQEDSATGRLHQMTGDTLHAFFEDDELLRMTVFKNSEVIFFLKDEDDQPDGVIELIAAGASTLFFYDGEFDRFKADENAEGTFLEEGPEVPNRRLENFQWDPERKPDRPRIQTPRLPAIPEEAPFPLPPRYVEYVRLRELSLETGSNNQ
ncbi:MAG: OstA-like protein [Balneolaceae bacterium]